MTPNGAHTQIPALFEVMTPLWLRLPQCRLRPVTRSRT